MPFLLILSKGTSVLMFDIFVPFTCGIAAQPRILPTPSSHLFKLFYNFSPIFLRSFSSIALRPQQAPQTSSPLRRASAHFLNRFHDLLSRHTACGLHLETAPEDVEDGINLVNVSDAQSLEGIRDLLLVYSTESGIWKEKEKYMLRKKYMSKEMSQELVRVKRVKET